MENYYQILGVPEDASEKDIKRAYRKLATEWHPDKHQGKDTLLEADTKFKAISEAYSILSDEVRRREYDTVRRGPSAFNFHTTGDPMEFISKELFQHLRRATRGPAPTVVRGHTVQMGCELSLGESLFGVERPITFTVSNVCPACNAKGAVKFDTCKACKGSGNVSQSLGAMHVKMTCHLCAGSGQSATEACQTCHGKRMVAETKTRRISIPPGVPSGRRLIFSGAGGTGTEGQAVGDLILNLEVKPFDVAALSQEEQQTLRNILLKNETPSP
jgi:molecular chaperone DnaJ